MPRKPGSRERIKNYLRTRVGKVVTSAEIQEVSGILSSARRVREIRNDEGWPILTHYDDSTLKPGQYRLAYLPPKTDKTYHFSKPISARIRAQVLERNGHTCQMCGVGAGDPDEQNPGRRVRLHLGHIKDKSHGGDDTLGNLQALCSTCNQGAKNLAQEPPSWTYLLSQIRRSKIDDQKEALEWLKRKFKQ